MKRVFLYNPANDIALATGQRRFTPPRQAELLCRYGAPVMWWLGDGSDYVVVPPQLFEENGDALCGGLQQTEKKFGPGPSLVTDLQGLDVESLQPWGWSYDMFYRLQALSAPQALLMGWMHRLDSIRNLSHRRTAAEINRRFAACIDFGRYGQMPPQPAEETTKMAEVECFAKKYGGFYIKSPWSSSGRGVVRGDMMGRKQLLARCEGIVRHQGSVMLEKAYEKVDDFAMLFETRGGRVRFYGYSLFFNARGASYGGNVITGDKKIREYLGRKINGNLLDEVCDSLMRILPEIIGDVYDGFMGVDMMVVKENGRYAVVPCVELNLRMTMGVIAHAVCERMGTGDSQRLMKVVAGGRQDFGNDCVHLVPRNGNFDIVVE